LSSLAANPPVVQPWQVPIALVDLVKIQDANWDLLITRVRSNSAHCVILGEGVDSALSTQIIPFINGINHVARIAELADADTDLTRLGIEHLL
jgi:hypothetical protein